MRAAHRRPVRIPRLIPLALALLPLAPDLAAAAATDRQAVTVAHQVVTAPWAAPSQAPGYKPTGELPRWEPPALLKTPPPPPLSPEQARIMAATQSEKLPEPTWLRYVVSNEWRHDVTFPRIAGLGGAYIGVATDQNYTMAAAARSELLFLFDYDLEVVRMHRIYHAFMAQSPTVAEFRALFDGPGVPRAREILAKAAPSPREAERLQHIYLHYRERLHVYLRHIANLRVGERHPTWLGDPAAYEYIRALVLHGRVQAVQGDLNGALAMKSIGETCRALKVPVRIVYTSNAEGFFKYTPAFRDNLASLPHDDKSIILRTYKHRFPSAFGDTWHYNLHQLDDFLGRIGQRGYQSVNQVMADLNSPAGKKVIDPLGVSYTDSSIPRH